MHCARIARSGPKVALVATWLAVALGGCTLSQKPLDTSDFVPIWRKHMARYYVACTLRELGGLPQALPEKETSVPFLRVFSSGPFS